MKININVSGTKCKKQKDLQSLREFYKSLKDLMKKHKSAFNSMGMEENIVVEWDHTLMQDLKFDKKYDFDKFIFYDQVDNGLIVDAKTGKMSGEIKDFKPIFTKL